MKKYLLLTTALASLMSASPAAHAADHRFGYDQNNGHFGLQLNGAANVTPYNNFTELAQAIEAQRQATPPGIAADDRIVPGGNNIAARELIVRTFLQDMFSIPEMREEGLRTPVVFNNVIDDYLKQLGPVKALVSSYSQQQNIEFQTFVRNQTTIGNFYLGSNIVNNYEIDKFITDNTTSFADRDSGFREAAADFDNLQNIRAANGFFTPAEQQRLNEVQAYMKQYAYASPEFFKVRNSVAAQEALKTRIEGIKKLEADLANAQDDAAKIPINTRLTAQLDALKADLDKYLVRNVKDASKVPAIQKSDSAGGEALLNSLLATTGVVAARMDSVDSRGSASGVSSGDLLQNYGVWIQGNMTRATQKAYSNESGYKLNQKGFTIGADTGDDFVIGAAYSFSVNDIKSKSVAASKDDIRSHLFSLYGRTNINEGIFATGQIQYGKSNIKKELHTGDIGNNVAKAKTKADSWVGRIQVGYDYEVAPQTYLVPSLGMSYANIDTKGYTMTGQGINRTVGKRSINRTSGLAGVTVKYVHELDAMKIMPEIHANIDYAFKTKNSATLVSLVNGIDPIATPSQKLVKALYNVGGSVKVVQSSMYEVSAGYDLGIAKKFQSHTGTVKLRVNL